MAVALTIFGVGAPDGNARFCYALLRPVRGNGGYPAPSLPRDALSYAGLSLKLDPSNLVLKVWDQVIEGYEAELEANIGRGRFSIPIDCPIEPGVVLEGTSFAPVQINENYNRVVCDGSGALWSNGFALSDGGARIIDHLRAATGHDEVGSELELLLSTIDSETGVGSLFLTTRRLGVVERLHRVRPGRRPGLLRARVIKPDLRGNDPCRRVVLCRDAAPVGVAFQVHLALRSWNNVVVNRLITLPANTQELTIDAGTHVTSIEFAAFDFESGDLLDQFEISIIQSMAFSLIGQSETDLLPKPFRGAQRGDDLEKRTRIHTGSFSGPSAGDRAGGFDSMRHNRQLIEALIGDQSWRGECCFFHTGPEPQLDVIRWIKRHLEDAQVAEAFLVDPYLGSEALKRVVVRHGNETVSLTLVVSPGDRNPDAPELDARGEPGRHLLSLVKAAEELADQLCGEIEIIHVWRGDGRYQAFHDRYFGLIDRTGVPRAYLLSNSLGKAAGDWPFVAVELDRVNSWIVTVYARGLIAGNDRGRTVHAERVWSSTAGNRSGTENIAPVEKAASPPEPIAAFRHAVGKTYLALHTLEQRGQPVGRAEVDKVIDEKLVASWPPDIEDVAVLANCILEGVAGRDQHAAAIADRLQGDPKLRPVANAIDDLLLDRIVGRIAPESKQPNSVLMVERIDLLHRAGGLIAERDRGTDFVRNRLNPALHFYARMLESGRSSRKLRSHDLLIAGLCIVLVGLEVAHSASKAQARHREALASDYIHFLGRLLRTSASEELFGGDPNMTIMPGPGEGFAREAIRMAKLLRTELGLVLDAVFDRLLADSLLLEPFKNLLKSD